MAFFKIRYSFDIQDTRKEELSYWERGTFEMEAENRGALDTDLIRSRIRSLAQEHCEKTYEKISYANYYGIEEVSSKKSKKGK